MKRYVIEEREQEDCKGCMFEGYEKCTFPIQCGEGSREDGGSVIFVLVKTEEIEADKCQKS